MQLDLDLGIITWETSFLKNKNVEDIKVKHKTQAKMLKDIIVCYAYLCIQHCGCGEITECKAL